MGRAVRSGLFGRHHSLVPLAQSRWDDGRLFVPYTNDGLAVAPHGDPEVALDAEQERVLFEHYNVGYSDTDRPGPHTGVEAADTGLTGTPEAGSHPDSGGRVFGTHTIDPALIRRKPAFEVPALTGPPLRGGRRRVPCART